MKKIPSRHFNDNQLCFCHPLQPPVNRSSLFSLFCFVICWDLPCLVKSPYFVEAVFNLLLLLDDAIASVHVWFVTYSWHLFLILYIIYFWLNIFMLYLSVSLDPRLSYAFCVMRFAFFFFFFFPFLHAFQGTSRTVEYCSVLFDPFLTFLSISGSVHCSRTHKFHFLSIFSLNMGLTVLFTHLKIILLQCFKFSVFSFSKISSIQTDP